MTDRVQEIYQLAKRIVELTEVWPFEAVATGAELDTGQSEVDSALEIEPVEPPLDGLLPYGTYPFTLWEYDSEFHPINFVERPGRHPPGWSFNAEMVEQAGNGSFLLKLGPAGPMAGLTYEFQRKLKPVQGNYRVLAKMPAQIPQGVTVTPLWLQTPLATSSYPPVGLGFDVLTDHLQINLVTRAGAVTLAMAKGDFAGRELLFCLDRHNGVFAFEVYDVEAKQSLTLKQEFTHKSVEELKAERKIGSPGLTLPSHSCPLYPIAEIWVNTNGAKLTLAEPLILELKKFSIGP